MSTAGNARFVNMGGGFTAEMISSQVQIHYNATTQHATAIFTGAPFIKMGDVYQRIGTSQDVLSVELQPYLGMRVAMPGIKDPVTGAELSNISLAGLSIIHKFAYDYFYNVRAKTPGYPLPPTMNGTSGLDDVAVFPV